MATRFVDAIARNGGPGAKMALLAIDALEPGGLGRHAYGLARQMSGDALPGWIKLVGHADVLRAESAHSPDGEVLFIEAHRGVDDIHTVAAYIDHRLGGAAKHLGLVRPIDQMLDLERQLDGGPSFVSELGPLDVGEACRRLVDAIEVTDGLVDPPVGERYAQLRALALTRALAHI